MDIQVLAQQFYDYSTHFKGYSKDTVRRYRYVINFYCKYTGIQNISGVTNENVRGLFFHGRTVRNWQPNTFLVFHKSLLVFFRWCIAQGHMQKNPAEDIEVPKVLKALPPQLTKADTMKLLEIVYNYPYENTFLRYRNHAIFSMFIFAGVRKNELLKLRFADIDLDNRSIFIYRGKGGKDRVIPILEPLAESLQRYLEVRKRLNKTCPDFFTSLNKNMRYTDAGLSRVVVQLRKASGLKFTIHRLRHTFATLMLEGGCDIYSLSRMMGHSDIKTTTIYLYASVEHLRSQITKHPLNDLVRERLE